MCGFNNMTWMEWYNTLSKPGWTPSPGTISLIWQILYPIILISFGYVFYQTARRRYPATTAVPFAINLIANLSFTPLFFGLRNVPLATLDILVVWSTILWIIYSIWPRSRWVALAQIPYLIWVSIATTIQVSIFWMN
ncbi:TspO/MBR family protein [Gimesia chilikensis]|uniref:TspO/MBR family protein n=1 Tax=Gimesia chilikensis TaxID=2605989 RepID=UPI0021BCF256|nr:TspO/MBR family protein [Gimesia chilikensis]